jgi:lysophospholipase L1-like esterase
MNLLRERLLSTPLILGASVSDNYKGVQSPGRLLALKNTARERITTVARNGATAENILAELDFGVLKDHTSVIALDLLFWDSFTTDPSTSLELVGELILKLGKLGIPIILGSIPGSFGSMQPSLARLNDEVERFASIYANCIEFPLDRFFKALIKDGGIHHNDRFFTKSAIMPDGLHLSHEGSSLLADLLEKSLLERYETL